MTGGSYNVSFDADGNPELLLGTFFPNIGIPVAPTLPAAQASLAARATGLQEPVVQSSQLVIHHRDDLPFLAYQLSLATTLGAHVVYVDAHTGEIHQALPQWSEATCSPTYPDTGNVFPVNAANAASLTPRRLGNAQSLTSLTGCYVSPVHNVITLSPPAYDDALGTAGKFLFSAADLHTVEVNAYYHVDRFLSAIDGMTTIELPDLFDNQSVGIFANVTMQQLGGIPASANPVGLTLTFGRPDAVFVGFNNAGLSADVIYHETQHLITAKHDIEGGANDPTARRPYENFALVEAISDYCAASFTDDAHINEWLRVTPCSGGVPVHNDSLMERWLDSDKSVFKYANIGLVGGCTGSVAPSGHGSGMILSGALWDLRKTIGARTDTLVQEALLYLPLQPDFTCMRDAVLQASYDYHGGANALQITMAFLDRGIKGCSFSIDTPDSDTLTVTHGQNNTLRVMNHCELPELLSATWARSALPCPLPYDPVASPCLFVGVPGDDIYDDVVSVTQTSDAVLRAWVENT